MSKIGHFLLLLWKLMEGWWRKDVCKKFRQTSGTPGQLPPGPATVDQFERLYSSFSEGVVAVRSSGKVGFADTGGKLVIPAQFRSAEQFCHGLACVSVGGNNGRTGPRYGYVDRSGRYQIWPRFTAARSFSEGLGCVAVGGRLVKVHLRKEHEVLADAKYGFVDQQGRFAIEPLFDYAGSFADGLAYVRIADAWAYIDKSGEVVISDAEFVSVNQFSEGLAPVLVRGRGYGYIDRKGNLVIAPKFTTAAPFRRGFAVVGLDQYPHQRYGYIDRSGKVVTRALRQDVSF